MPRVIVVGDIVTDIVAVLSEPVARDSDTAAHISIGGGGSAANTAAWLAWAGVEAVLAAVVGADVAGGDRLAELIAVGVDCSVVRRSEDAPTGSIIVLAEKAERSMLADRGANLQLLASDVDAALEAAPDAVHLHLSGYALLDDGSRAAGRHALAAASARGLTTSVDAASAAPLRRLGGSTFLDWVRGTDLLLANVDEARALVAVPDPRRQELSGRDLAQRLAEVARHVVVKEGSMGAIWAEPYGQTVAVAPQPATVVDPTGAGDAFAAGLLAAWLTGAGPEACLAAGATFGARAVGLVGGRPPRRPDGQ